MGMYNTSRSAMAAQPSYASQAPQPISDMAGPRAPGAGPLFSRGPVGTAPAAGSRGMYNTLSRPTQTAPFRQNYMSQETPGGVFAGQAPPPPQPQVPNLDQIQAEMARQRVGAQLNANPANSALAGYMMG